MKLGLDIHGVIDSNPEFFSQFTKAILASGGEVHIITGPAKAKVEEYLKANNISYTHFFSIVESGADVVVYDKDGDPWLPSEKWDRAKARYCKENKIDLHIDDSDVYGKYFKTPYARYKK